MDVVVIDSLDAWGMILSHKWVTDLGDSIQMELYYATIPTCENTYVTLHREQMRKHHVEDPLDPMNELVCYEKYLGSYTLLTTKIAPLEDVNITWKMNFDEAQPKIGVGARIMFVSPKGDTLWHDFHLEFEATKNVVGYEALLLGLNMAKDMGIKILKIQGESNLVIL